MRLMSFSLTTAQMREKTKTVTRRLGWTHLKTGDRVAACEKVMGRRHGEPLVRIGEIEVVDVRREPLEVLTTSAAYGEREVLAEGFPEMTPAEFVAMFCRTHKAPPSAKGRKPQPCTPATVVTRIQFRHV